MSEVDVLAIGPPGRAAAEMGPCAPTSYPDSADHELTECVVPGALILGASVRGLMHRYQRKPRQDRFSIVYDEATATLVITVCDGVGAFDLSQEAAAFVALEAPQSYLRHRDWQPAVTEVNEKLTQFVEGAANRTRLELPEDTRMATTLAAVAIRFEEGRRHASVAWTDDTTVWFLGAQSWTEVTGNPTEDDSESVHSTQVKALPHKNPRLTVVETELAGGALFVTSDGVGGPLARSQQVREALASWWAKPPDVFTFGQQVGFARRGELDDRTAVGVWFDPAC